mgnify:CR=1 FL=1
MDREKLLQLREIIDNLEKEVAQDEGSLRQMVQDLREQGFKSVEDASRKLKELETEIDKMDGQLSERIGRVEEMMREWKDGD